MGVQAGMQVTVGRERSRILNALLDDLDELADRATAAIRTEISAYDEQDDGFIADVRDQVLRHYRANLASFLEEREVAPEDIPFARGAAARRARVGFALEDYLNAYRVGQQALWEAILAQAGDSEAGRAAALTLATPVMRYADFASTHAARAYVEFQQYVVADADRERRDLLEHLLAGELPVRGPLLAAAQAYEIAAGARMLVATAVPVAADGNADVPHPASATITRAGLGAVKTLVVVRQAEIVAIPVLTPGTDEAAVCERLEQVQERLVREGMALSVGVSTVADGVAELPRAYLEARHALECVGDDGGLAALPRLSQFEYLALRPDATTERLVDPRIRDFLREDRARGGVLIGTLRAFADCNLRLAATAERLQLHPNTAQ